MPPTQSEIVVELSDAIQPVHSNLSGEGWGGEVRQQLGLDQLDVQPGVGIVLHFPEWTSSVTTSFIRGLLRPSVVTLTAAEFWNKYSFTGPDFLDVIEEEVTKAERFRLREAA